MNRSELAHIRESLTGVRSMISSYLYCSVGIPLLQRVMKDAKVDIHLSHEVGGVMDHMANIIDALTQAIGDGEPGDREPYFPSHVSSTCPNCGGELLGNGVTEVLHCERVSGPDLFVPVDSDPVYCNIKTLETT